MDDLPGATPPGSPSYRSATAWHADHEAMLRRAAELAMNFRRLRSADPHRPAKNFAEMWQVFAGGLPELGHAGFATIEELVALSEPGLASMTGPRFFGWVIGASHPIGVAADWLTSA
ncbi:MAG TPA: hypothetical protein VGF43_00955 [Dongiaceae bacterium]|jgi:hypothetical protein